MTEDKEEEKENHIHNVNQLPSIEIELLEGHDSFLQRKFSVKASSYTPDETLALFEHALRKALKIREEVKK